MCVNPNVGGGCGGLGWPRLLVGAILGAAMGPNLTIRQLKINPGGGTDGDD